MLTTTTTTTPTPPKTRYETLAETTQKETMKFQVEASEIEEKLKSYLISGPTPKKEDIPRIAQELLKDLLPFKIPSSEEILKIKAEISLLVDKLKEARKGDQEKVAITREEDMQNKALLNEKRRLLRVLETSLDKMQAINSAILHKTDIITRLETGLSDYFNQEGEAKQKASKACAIAMTGLLGVAQGKIIEQFSLEFSDELAEKFKALPHQKRQSFNIRHAKHIVALKRAESEAMLAPDDEQAQKNKLKEEILYQIESSNLQYDIMQEVSKTSEDEIIDSVLKPILVKFERGEKLGAYRFKFPGSVVKNLGELLQKNKELLRKREQNDIELAYCKEQLAGYEKLASNPSEYGIQTEEEGEKYEKLSKDFEERIQSLENEGRKLNQAFGEMIENFITEKSQNENEKVVKDIHKKLGTMAVPEIEVIMAEAEKKSQLGWAEWVFTETFASRCKNALVAATTAGGVGGVTGAVAGMGILSAPISIFTGATMAVLGGGAAFMSPEIEAAAKSKLEDFKKMGIELLYGKQNELAKEYFDSEDTTGLNPKYVPTERMRNEWGEDGANVIAYKYVDLLFNIHVKLLYSNPKEKAELEQMYKHFYLNYQMLRCDEAEIKQIYRDDRWGADTAQKQIAIARGLDLRKQVNDDISAMLSILEKTSKQDNNQLRKAINTVNEGVEILANVPNPTLLLQAVDSPEVRSLHQDTVAAIPLLAAPEKQQPDAPVIEEEKSQMTLVFDSEALRNQQIVTQVKENAVVIHNAMKKKEMRKKEYEKLNNLATMVNGGNTVSEMELVKPGFIRENTQHPANMNVGKAAICLQEREYEKFQFWYENIFLEKNRHKDNVTRKDAISRKLLSDDGQLLCDGKSLWHLLAENSTEGREIFLFMMRKQKEAGFENFVNYFDFDYVDANGMNAIVYAASLSGPRNDFLLKAYINEIFEGYEVGTQEQQKCDNTFKQIIQNVVPTDPSFQIICTKLRDEIQSLWNAKENEKYSTQGLVSRGYSAAKGLSFRLGLTSSNLFDFESEKVLSQLFASMAIYCTNHGKIPQTQEELYHFIQEFKKSEFVDESIKNIIKEAEVISKIALSASEGLGEENALYQFAKDTQNENIQRIARDLCTIDPLPGKDEQEILVALLSENTPKNDMHFKTLMANKSAVIYNLLANNVKFKNKNILWLAVEAGRPEVVKMLYNAHSNREAMDNAGPTGSLFTFAASRDDKTAFNHLCTELSARRGMLSQGYLTRFIPDQDARIAMHYLAERGSANDIENYLDISKRNRAPAWQKATGGPDSNLKSEPKFYLDNNKNTPLHLLLLRNDAENILAELNTYVKKNELTNIFDLFSIDALDIENANKQSPMTIIMANPKLNIIFDQLLDNAINYTGHKPYRDNLLKCAKSALLHGNEALLSKLANSLNHAHTANVGYGYLTNPVTAEIDDLIDYCMYLYRTDIPDEDRQKVRNFIYKVSANISQAKLEELLGKLEKEEKSLTNQSLFDALVYKRELTAPQIEMYHGFVLEENRRDVLEAYENEDELLDESEFYDAPGIEDSRDLSVEDSQDLGVEEGKQSDEKRPPPFLSSSAHQRQESAKPKEKPAVVEEKAKPSLGK